MSQKEARRKIDSLESDLQDRRSEQAQETANQTDITHLRQQLKCNEDRMLVCEAALAEEDEQCEGLRESHARLLTEKTELVADGVHIRRL